MTTSNENKVYLFQDFPGVLVQGHANVLKITSIKIARYPSQAENNVSKALANLIHLKQTEFRYGGRGSNTALSIQRTDPPMIDPYSGSYVQHPNINLKYQVALDADFLQSVCNILPRAFLEIEGTFNSQQTAPNIGKLHERLELQEIHMAVQTNGITELTSQFSFPIVGIATAMSARYGRHHQRLDCSFNFIIGWQEATAAIKINTTSLIQNLFENEDTKDLSIVAGNGATVKCHKIMFAAQSSVLSKMVTCGLSESKSGKVEMRESSEEGIKLLLRYLYGLELATENLPSDLVVELLEAAHKYDLAHLQSSLSEELLRKDANWFTPDTILELYFYIKNVKGLATLRDHSLKILTRMSTEDLRSCEGFKKLGKSTAIDLLCKLVDLLQ